MTEAAAKKAAAEAGDESPVVFVLLPKREADQIKEALASHAAAEETVQQKPVPQTEEGKAAEMAMRTRVASAEDRLNALMSDVVAHARVFQGGGNELTKASLRDAVQMASERALVRLFPKFTPADNPSWGKVVTTVGDRRGRGVCGHVFGSVAASTVSRGSARALTGQAHDLPNADSTWPVNSPTPSSIPEAIVISGLEKTMQQHRDIIYLLLHSIGSWKRDSCCATDLVEALDALHRRIPVRCSATLLFIGSSIRRRKVSSGMPPCIWMYGGEWPIESIGSFTVTTW